MHQTDICDDHIIVVSNNYGHTTAVEFVNGEVVGTATARLSPDDEYNWETGLDLALNRLLFGTDYRPSEVTIKEKILPMIEVGDIVEITDPGERYSSYRSWFTENNVSTKLWKPDRHISKGYRGVVLAKYPHGHENRLLYYVIMLNGGFGCLMSEDGITEASV